ncbi:MAG TPA: hypothetical protein VHJ99_09590, partial [Candidatus Dormibacteraeota bacterium]|nr:hypothetical protein [Candidatus Dormibacteraeota bacterium]
KVWSDHADIRPTVLALTDLKDDYAHQGRPITEVIAGLGEDGNGSDLHRLAALYKKINAPVGQLSLDSVKFATKATLSSSAGDQTYIAADARIAVWTVRRDTLAAKIILLLDNTAPSRSDSDSGSDSGSDDADARGLAAQAVSLLAEVHRAAA